MIEVLKNEISQDGMKTVRLLSDRAVSDARLLKLVPGAAREWAKISRETNEGLSLHHVTITYPLREVVEVRMQNAEGRMRRLAVWKMVPEEGYRVSEIIAFLVEWYFMQTHRMPEFAFMKKLPKEAISGQLLAFGEGEDGVMLMEADWALQGCVMVGG